MLSMSVIVTLGGINKVMKMSLVAIPVLIFSTILIASKSFDISSFSGLYLDSGYFESFFSAITYVSFNIIMAISILPILGNSSKDLKEINKAAIIAGVIIGIFGIIICLSLLINYGKIQFVEIPLAALAKQSNSVYEVLYFISFTIAVLTTAVSALYGIYTRINRNYKKIIIIVICAYIGSLFGFSVLVKYVYSFMGYIGFIIIFMLLRGFSKRKKHLR